MKFRIPVAPAQDLVIVESGQTAAFPDNPNPLRRDDGPTLQLYRFTQLPWTSVTLHSPFDHVIVTPVIRLICDWGWPQDYVNDDTSYKKFQNELMNLGFERGVVPGTLFHPFTAYGSYLNGRKRGFKTAAAGLSHDIGKRRAGCLVLNSELDNAVRVIEQSLSKEGARAFLEAPEGAFSPGVPHSYVGLGRVLGLPLQKFRELPKLDQLSLVNEALTMAEGYEDGQWLEGHYIDLVDGVFGSGSGGNLRPSDGLELSLLEARLKLVRTLSCRVHLWTLADRFSDQGVHDQEARQLVRETIIDLLTRYPFSDEEKRVGPGGSDLFKVFLASHSDSLS